MPGAAAIVLVSASFVAGMGVAVLLLRFVRSPDMPPELDRKTAVRFGEAERDRLQAQAKGIASGVGGFLVALVTALVKDEVTTQVSPLEIVCLVLGAVGLLILAAAQSQASARYMAKVFTDYASPAAAPPGKPT